MEGAVAANVNGTSSYLWMKLDHSYLVLGSHVKERFAFSALNSDLNRLTVQTQAISVSLNLPWAN